jgi:hypothetical protein
MATPENPLAEREIYLLGVLARRKGKPILPTKNTLRGCGPAQFQALVSAGYASAITSRLADGSQELAYEITELGLKVWNTFQFVLGP